MMFNKLTVACVAAFVIRSTSADTIYGIAGTAEGFATLANMIDLAGLGDALSADTELTVFAPDDSAFAALPAELVTKYTDPTWKPQLQDILLHHVVEGKVLSSDLSDGMTVLTLNRDDVTIGLNPPTVTGATNQAPSNIELVDVMADNGVIHGIDSVLTPTSLTSDIVAVASGKDMFSTLVAAVSTADLVEALSGPGPFTVFAPTNKAFDDLPEGTVDNLLKPESKDALVDILKYHVVAANAHSSVLASGDVPTLSGDSVTVMVSEDGGVKINDANVITSDVIASNGIIHVVDAVLLPPTEEDASAETNDEIESIYSIASTAEDFSTLASMIDLAGLGNALTADGELTVFAPSNSAFAKLPTELVTKYKDPTWKPQLEDILLHHVIEGKVLSSDLSDGMTAPTLNGEEVTITLNPPSVTGASNESPCKILIDAGLVDVVASNGVIHATDSVLIPTSLTSDIVDIASGNDMFSTLVAAVTAAGLGEALMGEGPFTIMAPTNDAFAALPEGTVEDLLKPENKDKLIEVLQYHVVAANAPSSSLVSGDVDTLSGDSFAVVVSDGGITINAANVKTADVIASNGIIHVIDAVLMPPAEDDDAGAGMDAADAGSDMKPEVEDTDSGAFGHGLTVTTAVAVAGVAILV